MATRTLQPSEYEIQREVEALRGIRRRSITPGALTIDPDLPNQSPPSPTNYWSGSSPTASPLHSPSTPHEDIALSDSSRAVGSVDAPGDPGSSPNNPADDPFHLFWVPASLHPEIAPAEFRAFLKEHARSPPPTDTSDTPSRSNSFSSSSLGRRSSLLSRQYKPSEHDNIEDEEILPFRRNRTSLYGNRGPQLTIGDLQKLEELAEEASESDDPSKLRNVLRRSLSFNISPSAIDQMDDIPDMGDEADAPIIVPPPGQILRRAARTKIRKPGLPGDGGGHRFGSTRRGTPTRPTTAPVESRTSSEMSSSDHGESVESTADQRRRTFSDEGYKQRPDSFSEEASIFDAYAREEEDELLAPVVVSLPPLVVVELPEPQPHQPEVQVKPSLLEALGPVIHQPQPQQLLTPQLSIDKEAPPSRTPSPSEPIQLLQPEPSTPTPPQSPPSFLSTIPSPPAHQRKDKGGKGLFGKWGNDKAGKKNGKDKDRENRDRAAEKEKESGFFGSLFGGGSKKKQEQEFQSSVGVHGGNAGREAAQALLGASKSKASAPSSPGLPHGVGTNSYARYPIHVERAIYRLSHIKLANPRRPLYEQVLISNLMFWYLGVINKAQSPVSPQSVQGATGMAATGGPNGETEQNEKERAEKEQREQKEQAEKERQERERVEREQREREVEMKKKESGRRGSLTKIPAPGSPGAGRRAEMPVKGPQYEMQHRVMEQEYGGYSPQTQQMGRSASAPAGPGNGGQQYPRMQQPLQAQQFLGSPPKLVHSQPQQQQIPEHYYYPPDSMQNQQIPLPPGAMHPADQQTWLAQQSPAPLLRTHTSSDQPVPQGPLPSLQERYIPNSSQESLVLGSGGNKMPSRSLSATAVSPQPPQINGKARKGASAHAVLPHGKRPGEGWQDQNGGEEDVPLAVWQQRRR